MSLDQVIAHARELLKSESGGGWQPIPGGHHSGFRKPKAGGGYAYRYETGADHLGHMAGRMRAALSHGSGGVQHEHIPEPEDARAAMEAAVAHAKTLKGAQRKNVVDAIRHVRDASRDVASKSEARRAKNAAGSDYQHTIAARSVRDHADAALTALRPEKKAAPAPEVEAPTEAAVTGKHRIAGSGKGGKIKATEVDTVHMAGIYGVHTDGKKQGSAVLHSVTHIPSGMTLGRFPKGAAVSLANHMHAHAGDAGSDATFGSQPSDAAMVKLREAFKAHAVKKSLAFVDEVVNGGDVVAKSVPVQLVGSCLYFDRGPVQAAMTTSSPGVRREAADAPVVVKSEPAPVWAGSRSASGRLVRPGSSLKVW